MTIQNNTYTFTKGPQFDAKNSQNAVHTNYKCIIRLRIGLRNCMMSFNKGHHKRTEDTKAAIYKKKCPQFDAKNSQNALSDYAWDYAII